MANVLIIDDDKAMCDRIANAVERLGQKSACAHTHWERDSGKPRRSPSRLFSLRHKCPMLSVSSDQGHRKK